MGQEARRVHQPKANRGTIEAGYFRILLKPISFESMLRAHVLRCQSGLVYREKKKKRKTRNIRIWIVKRKNRVGWLVTEPIGCSSSAKVEVEEEELFSMPFDLYSCLREEVVTVVVVDSIDSVNL